MRFWKPLFSSTSTGHEAVLRRSAEAAGENCASAGVRLISQRGVTVAELQTTPPIGSAPTERSTAHTAGSCAEAWALGGRT